MLQNIYQLLVEHSDFFHNEIIDAIPRVSADESFDQVLRMDFPEEYKAVEPKLRLIAEEEAKRPRFPPRKLRSFKPGRNNS